ncbi:hypothetical protein [Leifsonia sp. fls2-241-R2A-40a]|uniref:hypothetical protein n=1 Tax=Leifsonia sp. fls2-241-R2A-40a TaxID=3040290 RepID=UPI00254B9A16|nr:hypothetical protein [Leifsonia sp. fls2-241-R2A-40a]
MGDVLAFIGCFILFLFGLFLLGMADTFPAWQGLVFFLGIICIALSFGIPVGVLGRAD